MWVRGLKLFYKGKKYIDDVAPYVGAWIETNNQCTLHPVSKVAPYVGAWIETSNTA